MGRIKMESEGGGDFLMGIKKNYIPKVIKKDTRKPNIASKRFLYNVFIILTPKGIPYTVYRFEEDAIEKLKWLNETFEGEFTIQPRVLK